MNCVEYCIGCEIFCQILESVQYLHELNLQIIHRDIKPDNILIAHNVRNGRFIKLCDFGLAIFHGEYNETDGTDEFSDRLSSQHTTDVGTRGYMAPEIHMSTYNSKVDIYSLARTGGELFDVDIIMFNSILIK
ncbi:unnamed protein product [Oppiella nova]|uniref:Protein kinase domain-containing protein n=1 Tax=Oppiella nova TaxID=334625 RepID=A0A7R9LMI5_9ACAR|nr:unnamed protein product [Oppiella nova]CAG2164731.1 unnamed protein product [Oppiella nova]